MVGSIVLLLNMTGHDMVFIVIRYKVLLFPLASEANCRYTSLHKYVITIQLFNNYCFFIRMPMFILKSLLDPFEPNGVKRTKRIKITCNVVVAVVEMVWNTRVFQVTHVPLIFWWQKLMLVMGSFNVTLSFKPFLKNETKA